MRDTRLPLPLGFLIFLLVLSLICSALGYFAGLSLPAAPSLQDEPTLRDFTVVLDAGHGGEDGGAVSDAGIFEKDLNLEIAFLVKEILEACSVKVVMTRTEDILLYDRNVDFQGRKKALDLAARRKIAEETENAIFVSIHMNAYPLKQYSGLQVWHSRDNEIAQKMAKTLQSTAKFHLQPNNNRQVKPATSSIYLLHHLTCPAVLVECGFLSNDAEAERLADASYQRELAFVIAYSIIASQVSA